jgi:hypothetical protein
VQVYRRCVSEKVLDYREYLPNVNQISKITKRENIHNHRMNELLLENQGFIPRTNVLYKCWHYLNFMIFICKDEDLNSTFGHVLRKATFDVRSIAL